MGWVVVVELIVLSEFRPRSMVGGDLHWIWSPYALYQEIDYVRPLFLCVGL